MCPAAGAAPPRSTAAGSDAGPRFRAALGDVSCVPFVVACLGVLALGPGTGAFSSARNVFPLRCLRAIPCLRAGRAGRLLGDSATHGSLRCRSPGQLKSGRGRGCVALREVLCRGRTGCLFSFRGCARLRAGASTEWRRRCSAPRVSPPNQLGALERWSQKKVPARAASSQRFQLPLHVQRFAGLLIPLTKDVALPLATARPQLCSRTDQPNRSDRTGRAVLLAAAPTPKP